MTRNRKTVSALIATSIPAILLAAQLIAQNDSANTANGSSPGFVSSSQVKWGALNPARGAAGPRAGNLWGDRTGKGATGFLVKFSDGFSSPPHIHNVTYRGVVISGLVHNDDPDAAEMWMPPGSFWTQPAGEVHITAARGENVMVYIEIESGPYLVKPAEEASDNGERPVNVDASNIVWLDSSESSWVGVSGPEIAFLWNNEKGNRGTLLKLPAGFSGIIQSEGNSIYAVAITGNPAIRESGEQEIRTLDPGSYFGSEGGASHEVTNSTGAAIILYIRTGSSFQVVPTSPEN